MPKLMTTVLILVTVALVIGANGQRFDRAIKAYEGAVANKDAISLALYTEGSRELQGVIKKFGKLFSFADGEFGKMVTTLETIGFSVEGSRNPAYDTIQSAVEYEIREGLLSSKKPSATRTVAKLQWAMRWLSNFMLKLRNMGDNEGTASAAKKAYSEIFGKHHPWVIRTAVGLALRTLAKKRNLLQKIMDDDSEAANSQDLRNEKIIKFANVTDELIRLLDRFYAEKNLNGM